MTTRANPPNIEIPELEVAESPRIVAVLEDPVITFHLRVESGKGDWMSNSSCLDLLEFEAALQAEGVYEILTCSCGVPECAGRWKGIAVWFRGDDIVWLDLDRNIWTRFRRRHLEAELDKLKSRLPFYAHLGGGGPRFSRGELSFEPCTTYRFFRKLAGGDSDQESEASLEE